MNNKENGFHERRGHKRFRVRGFFAIANTPQGGPLVDISRSGFSYRCLPEEQSPDDSLKFGTLVGDDFCLNKVPIEPVSEATIDNGVVLTKRCGFKFGKMTPTQAKQLKNFILIKTLNQVKNNLVKDM